MRLESEKRTVGASECEAHPRLPGSLSDDGAGADREQR